MDTLSTRYATEIKSVLEGFDRIVFEGYLKPISKADGMQSLLQKNGVLNKDNKE